MTKRRIYPPKRPLSKKPARPQLFEHGEYTVERFT